jgi:hypothetical protein
MFENARSLTSIDVSMIDATNATVDDIFKSCANLSLVATNDEKITSESINVKGVNFIVDANGGEFEDKSTLKVSDLITVIPDFTDKTLENTLINYIDTGDIKKDGYVLDKWTTSASGSSAIDILSATYTANWKDNNAPIIKTDNISVQFNTNFDFKDYIEYSDDNTVNDKLIVELINNTVNTLKIGNYEIEVKVTDEQGLYTTKKIPVRVYGTNKPEITGEDIELTIKDEFNPLDYIQVSDIETDTKDLIINILENTVDTSTEGIYKVKYEVIDEDNMRDYLELNVIVKKAIEDVPVSKPETKPETKPDTKPSDKDDNNQEGISKPATGDTSILSYGIMFLSSTISLIITNCFTKKDRKNK